MLLISDPMTFLNINFFVPPQEQDDELSLFHRHEFLKHSTAGCEICVNDNTKRYIFETKATINRTNEILHYFDNIL